MQVPVDPKYDYNYKRVTAGPTTPDSKRGIHNIEVDKTMDSNSYRSDISGYSSNPSSPKLIQKGLSDNQKQQLYSNMDAVQGKTGKIQNDKGVDRKKSIDDESHENVEEVTIFGDKVLSERGKRNSDDNKDSIDEDEEFKKLDGELITVTLEQNNYGLGISLAGHRDRETMRTFICGLHPRGAASESGELVVGDLLIRVGEVVVWDRCHLNVTSIIKNMASHEKLSITVLRNKKYAGDLSVKPVTHYPLLLDDMVTHNTITSSII